MKCDKSRSIPKKLNKKRIVDSWSAAATAKSQRIDGGGIGPGAAGRPDWRKLCFFCRRFGLLSASLPWHGPDLVDIQLPLDGEYVIAHLVAGEESCAHILGKIELLIVELDPKEFPALAQLHVPVSSGDLLADLQYPGFHNSLTSLMIIIASCIYF